MQPPHKFPSLIDIQSTTRPVLLIGAGMSAEVVPMPHELVCQLAPKQALLEKILGCSPAVIQINPSLADTLYQWADEMFVQLTTVQHLTPSEAKKSLADVFGVTKDACWRGRTKMPLRGNTPRHRVIARLAREGRWYAFWSLNWDCVLETALESVGMPIHPETQVSKKLPWAEWHRTWTQPAKLPPHDDENAILIVKPHGCAGKLTLGACDTFKVTSSELAFVGKSLEQDEGVLKNHFFQRPLVTCGWSASEAYLQELFKGLSEDSSIPANVLDPLSIINLKPDEPNQLSVISAYKIDLPEKAQIKVNLNSCTTDNLFLWVQTRFGLNTLKNINNAPVVELEALLNLLEFPVPNHWINDWFDNYLPVWMRFCFNAGITKFIVNAAPMDFDAIPTDRRDEHIPCGYQKVLRPDLQMATRLLLKLSEDNNGERWDFGRFPGALWDKESRRLILPQPCMNDDEPPRLSILKMMAENHHWERMGEIMKFDILLIDQTGNAIMDPDFSENLRLSVSKLMKHSYLADHNNIGVVDFSSLLEQAK